MDIDTYSPIDKNGVEGDHKGVRSHLIDTPEIKQETGGSVESCILIDDVDDPMPSETVDHTLVPNSIKRGYHHLNESPGSLQHSVPEGLDPDSSCEDGSDDGNHATTQGRPKRARSLDATSQDRSSPVHEPGARPSSGLSYTRKERLEGKDFIELLLNRGATKDELHALYEAEFGRYRTWDALRTVHKNPNIRRRLTFNGSLVGKSLKDFPDFTARERFEGKSFVESLLDSAATTRQVENAYKTEFGIDRLFFHLQYIHNIHHAQRRAAQNGSLEEGVTMGEWSEREIQCGNGFFETWLNRGLVAPEIENLWRNEFGTRRKAPTIVRRLGVLHGTKRLSENLRAKTRDQTLSSYLTEQLEEKLVGIFGGPPKCLPEPEPSTETSNDAPTTEPQVIDLTEECPAPFPAPRPISWTEILDRPYSLEDFKLQSDYTYQYAIRGSVVEISLDQHLMISLGSVQFMLDAEVSEGDKEWEMLHATRSHFIRYQDVIRDSMLLHSRVRIE
ncbi:uncharacterized protein N7506_002849 [Penicillium brevicompactum]|uniref:uncharacterized protein n=1 Tax=Penicillium brevicompactum TaxID=5074 RepID=UPI002540CDC1|nr:uncharacterized protein N7506_002849 [Penicillium brevicompactum]KAJ5343025.1 hypothetical protein N7506_002849 [Penicillium brevicompactum]